MGQEFPEPLRGREARRLHGHMDARFMGGVGQVGGELRLLQHLAAGHRHAAAGLVIEGLVLDDLGHDLGHRVVPSAVGLVLHGVGNGGIAVLGLGVGAPAALQRAALEEHRRPDARAVVDAEFLNVEKPSCPFHGKISLALFVILIIAEATALCKYTACTIFLCNFVVFHS